MRDIKFEVIFRIHNKDFTQSFGKHYTSVERLTNGQDVFDYKNIEVIAKRQFTGLKDVNSKEIYEGDIIKKPSGVWGVMVWKAPSFEVTVDSEQSSLYSLAYFDDVEVIGNIHENPELLEEAA